jgi:hypothetical protein
MERGTRLRMRIIRGCITNVCITVSSFYSIVDV